MYLWKCPDNYNSSRCKKLSYHSWCRSRLWCFATGGYGEERCQHQWSRRERKIYPCTYSVQRGCSGGKPHSSKSAHNVLQRARAHTHTQCTYTQTIYSSQSNPIRKLFLRISQGNLSDFLHHQIHKSYDNRLYILSIKRVNTSAWKTITKHSA